MRASAPGLKKKGNPLIRHAGHDRVHDFPEEGYWTLVDAEVDPRLLSVCPLALGTTRCYWDWRSQHGYGQVGNARQWLVDCALNQVGREN